MVVGCRLVIDTGLQGIIALIVPSRNHANWDIRWSKSTSTGWLLNPLRNEKEAGTPGVREGRHLLRPRLAQRRHVIYGVYLNKNYTYAYPLAYTVYEYTSWVLVTITGVHSNQDQIPLVKIRKYIGFYVDRKSWLLWSPVIQFFRFFCVLFSTVLLCAHHTYMYFSRTCHSIIWRRTHTCYLVQILDYTATQHATRTWYLGYYRYVWRVLRSIKWRVYEKVDYNFIFST